MLIGTLPHLSVSKAVQYRNLPTSVVERMTPVHDEDNGGVPSALQCGGKIDFSMASFRYANCIS